MKKILTRLLALPIAAIIANASAAELSASDVGVKFRQLSGNTANVTQLKTHRLKVFFRSLLMVEYFM